MTKPAGEIKAGDKFTVGRTVYTATADASSPDEDGFVEIARVSEWKTGRTAAWTGRAEDLLVLA